MLEYSMEELLPLVSYLSGKYTGEQSAPVNCETAEKLVKAVKYCIREIDYRKKDVYLTAASEITAKKAYAYGYQLTVKKTKTAKCRYDRIMNGFLDYGCRNYADTMIDAIPQFFLRYDPLFAPFEDIVTLSYPVLLSNGKLSGIDKMDEYLFHIEIEKEFLSAFSNYRISSLLRKRMPGYASLYVDNITEPVLLRAIGCMAADEKVSELSLSADDLKLITEFFSGESMERVVFKVKSVTEKLMHCLDLNDPDIYGYFLCVAESLAKRIYHSALEQYLSDIF